MVAQQERQKVADLLKHGEQLLRYAGIAESRIDAELLLGFCLQKSRTSLYLAADRKVEQAETEHYLQMLAQRARRQPLAYIVGEREFWSKTFHVSPAVLIPRPETEFLLEMVLAHTAMKNRDGLCLDLCCGSGVIAVVLATEMERKVLAVDISGAALAVARMNVQRHNLSSRVSLVQADLFAGFLPGASFSLIVSNPPYVPRREIEEELEPEVAHHEPRLALDGGEFGLDVIAAIKDALPDMLVPGGDCFIEIGDGQGASVRSLFLEHEDDRCFRFVEIYNDYSGRQRVAHIRKA